METIQTIFCIDSNGETLATTNKVVESDKQVPKLIWKSLTDKTVSEHYVINQKDFHRNPNEGPAVINYTYNGDKIGESYYVNGSRHNLNGPAKIEYDKQGNQINKEYYINGNKLDELAFLVKTSIERANKGEGV